jgi:ATP-dependent Clp protease ATP-binding subunit ClpB
MEWLAQLGYDPQFGARPVKRVIQKQILNELSKQLLSGHVNKEKEIVVGLKNNQFTFSN